MNYNTVYVGMDVHKESFTLCAYTIDAEKGSHFQRTEADYKNVLKYLEFLRTVYGNDANFICGYEAGCLGYTLYHQLTEHDVNCVILAPTTMLEQRSKRRIKTDRRDAEIIGKCLAQHNYSPVHIPTATDEETKEFLRMRDDHKLALKKVKQQILAFCLRHNYRYDGNSHWTAAHIKWLKSLNPEALYKEILDEYLLTYTTLSDKVERLDKRIEELLRMNTENRLRNSVVSSVSRLTPHYLFWSRLVIFSVLRLHRILRPTLDLFRARIPAVTDRQGLVLPKPEIAMSVCSLQKLLNAMPVVR